MNAHEEYSILFDDLMRQVDNQLVALNVPIFARHMRAIGMIASAFKLPLAIGRPDGHPQLLGGWPVSSAISKWYTENYGERNKLDWSPGRIAILLDGDVWVIRLPYIFGSIRFVMSRDLEFKEYGKSNVISLIDNLPQAKSNRLTDDQIRYIWNIFHIGYIAMEALRASKGDDLISIAYGNALSSVDYIVAQRPQYGESRWASLQAAEKVLKAILKTATGDFTHTHDLDKLIRGLSGAGISGGWSKYVGDIQCWPSSRYEPQGTSPDAAIAAHHACLRLIADLADDGYLKSGIRTVGDVAN